MHLTAEDKARIGDGITVVKEPPGPDRPAQRDPDVSETVSVTGVNSGLVIWKCQSVDLRRGPAPA